MGERIAVAGVGDFKLAKQIAKTKASSLGSSGDSTEHAIELLIEEPTTTQLSSSEEDVENIDPIAEANAYSNSSSELTLLARRVQQNAKKLTLGTALGLANSTLPVEKSPIDMVAGWTCETRTYNDGTCDCDCDGGQTILRGCPSHAEINSTGTPFEFANSVRAYCVNNADVVTCSLAVPPDDLCNEWPCVDSDPSDALVSYLQRASSNELKCVKRQSSPHAMHTGECALSMLDERGDTLEPILSWNSTDLPASPQSQTSSSVPSSPRPDVPALVPSSPHPDVPAPVPSPANPSPSPIEVRILARTIARLNSSIASKEAWIESAPRVYQEKSKEEKKQRNVYSAALSTMRRLVRKVRWQERKNARLAARGRPVVDLTQMKEDLQTAESNVSKCKSAWTIARRERKARTTSKIRQAQRNLRALKDQLRRLEGEYAAATSLTPSAGAHLGSVRDRYAYSRYISLLYASTFIIGVVALAGVRRRMSSDAVHVAIARGAVPTYGAVDV